MTQNDLLKAIDRELAEITKIQANLSKVKSAGQRIWLYKRTQALQQTLKRAVEQVEGLQHNTYLH